MKDNYYRYFSKNIKHIRFLKYEDSYGHLNKLIASHKSNKDSGIMTKSCGVPEGQILTIFQSLGNNYVSIWVFANSLYSDLIIRDPFSVQQILSEEINKSFGSSNLIINYIVS